jgi:hypothetical protein
MVSQQIWEHDSTKKNEQEGEIPPMFSGLSKARESLVSQWHVSSYSTSDILHSTGEKLPAKLPAASQAGAWQKTSTSILERWSSAYDVYLDIRGDNLTEVKRRGTAALSIRKSLALQRGCSHEQWSMIKWTGTSSTPCFRRSSHWRVISLN